MMTIEELENRIKDIKDRNAKIKYVTQYLDYMSKLDTSKPRTLYLKLLHYGPGNPKFEYAVQEDAHINQSIRNTLALILDKLEGEAESDPVSDEYLEYLEDILDRAREVEARLTAIEATVRSLENVDWSSASIDILINGKTFLRKECNESKTNFSDKQYIFNILKDTKDYYQGRLDGLLDI